MELREVRKICPNWWSKGQNSVVFDPQPWALNYDGDGMPPQIYATMNMVALDIFVKSPFEMMMHLENCEHMAVLIFFSATVHQSQL